MPSPTIATTRPAARSFSTSRALPSGSTSGRTVVILEDVIDTGTSIRHLLGELALLEPERILTATLFFKPKALIHDIPVNYAGIELENDFVVGYGLDYKQLGRNLPELYILNE